MHTTIDTPIGRLALIGEAGRLQRVHFPEQPDPVTESSPGALPEARSAFQRYFAGDPDPFSQLALDVRGPAFSQLVWKALLRIPYGETTTYGAIASQLADQLRGVVAPARAVGSAVGRTPIPIVIPCHRVIGADGSLTGYGGGLDRKRGLLAFEGSGGDPAALSGALAQRQLTLS